MWTLTPNVARAAGTTDRMGPLRRQVGVAVHWGPAEAGAGLAS